MDVKKMTAVEWLIENYFGNLENCTPNFRNKINQAKAMEKYQIIDAYEIGYDEGLQIITKYDGPLDYFNKTYVK